jgi:predicted HicB family RNase H-like nuclease
MTDERTKTRRRRTPNGISKLPGFNLRIPATLHTRIDREAGERGVTKTAVIEDALRERYGMRRAAV